MSGVKFWSLETTSALSLKINLTVTGNGVVRFVLVDLLLKSGRREELELEEELDDELDGRRRSRKLTYLFIQMWWIGSCAGLFFVPWPPALISQYPICLKAFRKHSENSEHVLNLSTTEDTGPIHMCGR